MDEVVLSEVLDSLHSRPGLIFGSDATTSVRSFHLIIENVKSKIELEADFNEQNYGATLDYLSKSDPEKADSIKLLIQEELKSLTPNHLVEKLIQANWAACISLTRDLLFESALEEHHDSVANSRAVTIIDAPSFNPQPRSLPIYKLLGNLRNTNPASMLALSNSSVLRRKSCWPTMLNTVGDFLHGAPLVFYGTNCEPAIVQELISTLAVLPNPAPRSLIFLKDDPILEDPTAMALCESFTEVKVVNAGPEEFALAVMGMKPKQRTLALGVPSNIESSFYNKYKDILSSVPRTSIDQEEFENHRQELIDSYFRPNALDWDPHLCEIGLERDITYELSSLILENIFSNPLEKIINLVVRGDAGVGKTAVLKSLCVNLARKNVAVYWGKKAPFENRLKLYRDFCRDVNVNAKKEGINRVAIVLDDPWSLRVDPSELVNCFSDTEIAVVFVYGLRNTEYFNQSSITYMLPLNISHEFEVPLELSAKELSQLPEMLVRTNSATTIEDAKKVIDRIPYKNSRDILCSLWYLVPETRAVFSASLRDEHQRIGKPSESIRSIALNVSKLSGKSAQHAYELVAVTSKYQIGMPLEVLVRALGISYEEFLDISRDGRPLWGLIYAQDDEANETITYRTRNEIVTQVLIELVNGGVGRTGEFRALRQLIESCSIGTQVYREFTVEILVKSAKDLEKNFTYMQGLELFQVARDTLPNQDRLLEHHMGLWMQRVGKEFGKAYSQFEKALDSNNYPGTEREEIPEHIHTSMAAAIVGLVKEGNQDAGKGFEAVTNHLQKASNPKIFNAHTGHISANLLFEMAQQQGALNESEIGAPSYSEALNQIEKTLQSIGPVRASTAKSRKSIEMLKELQSKILVSLPADVELEDYARNEFETKRSQLGFELLLRKRFSEAQITDKGSSYNSVKNLIENILHLVGETKETLSIEISAIRADLIVRWRLQKARGDIDWKMLRDDLQTVLNSTKYRDDPIKSFYYAVALFHTCEYENSHATFAGLRRMQAIGLSPREVRFFAVGKEGHPKRYQCEISNRHERKYAQIPEIDFDIHVANNSRKVVNHTYIGFSLNGPIAIFDRPDDNRMIMA